MPHKRNPIGSENITGLSRVLRGYMSTAYENVALWHERDISHSSAERIIIPDATILLDYMLHRFTGIVKNLTVYPENMLRNMEKSLGLIYSQRILLALIDKGLSREKRTAWCSPGPWKPGKSRSTSGIFCSRIPRSLPG